MFGWFPYNVIRESDFIDEQIGRRIMMRYGGPMLCDGWWEQRKAVRTTYVFQARANLTLYYGFIRDRLFLS